MILSDKTLVVTGERDQLVMSGAASSWHDLALFLIARALGPASARAVARFYAFQWHAEGLAPYAVFEPRTDHGDAIVLRAQTWLAEHLAADSPVEEMARRSALPQRSFKRRFKKATGMTVIDYVQRLRVEQARGMLEGGEATVDDISWRVGYEDVAFFRRLFKRVTGLTPKEYRRKFQLPQTGKR